MRSLRFSILALAACYGFFLVVGQPFNHADSTAGFQPFVFGLAGTSALLGAGLPTVRKLPPLIWQASWLAAYAAGRYFLPQSQPVPAGYAIYLSIAELAFVSLCAFLSWRLACNLAEPEEILTKVLLPDVSRRVRQVEEADEEIKTEFIRSRRNNLSMSVLLVAPDPASFQASLNRSAREIIQKLLNRFVSNSLIQLIDNELRRTDLILEHPGRDQLILLLKDTDAEGTSLLVERIQQLSTKKLGVSVHCSYATFPDEALTFEELVNQAETFLPSHLQFKELLQPGKESGQEFRKISQPIQ
jgi:hypothetical protein